MVNKFYVGYTGDDIMERLRRHNSNHKGYTGTYSDWEIMYTEIYPTQQEALLREKAIKSKKSRKYIEMLVAGSVHPDL